MGSFVRAIEQEDEKRNAHPRCEEDGEERVDVSIVPEAQCHDAEDEKWEKERLSTSRMFEVRRGYPFEHILFAPQPSVEGGADGMRRIERGIGEGSALKQRLPKEAETSRRCLIQSVAEVFPSSREKLIYPAYPVNAHVECEEVEQKEPPGKQEETLIVYNPGENGNEEHCRTKEALEKIIRDFESVNA